MVSGPLKLAGPFDDSPQNSTEKWDRDFMILKTSIKNWPAEYHSQSAIDAALELRKQIKGVEEIESITIESHDASVDIIGSSPEQWRPPSRETADHSLPYITAAALADGEITDRQFERSRFTDAKLLDLVAKVKVTRNAELSGKYPLEVGNIVSIRTKAGKTLSQRVDVPPGNAKRPLTDDQVRAKFHSMADGVIGKQQAEKIADWVWKLDEQNDAGELMPLLVVK